MASARKGPSPEAGCKLGSGKVTGSQLDGGGGLCSERQRAAEKSGGCGHQVGKIKAYFGDVGGE